MLDRKPDLSNIFQKKNWLKIAAAFFILFLIGGGVFFFSYGNNSPIDDFEASREQYSQNSSMPDLLIKLVFSMAIISGLIYVTVYLIRYLYGKRNTALKGQAGGKAPVKILNTTSLSANKSIHVVKILKEILVIGVTDYQVNVISKIEPEEWEDYGVDEDIVPDNNSFANIFTKYMKGRKK